MLEECRRRVGAEPLLETVAIAVEVAAMGLLRERDAAAAAAERVGTSPASRVADDAAAAPQVLRLGDEERLAFARQPADDVLVAAGSLPAGEDSPQGSYTYMVLCAEQKAALSLGRALFLFFKMSRTDLFTASLGKPRNARSRCRSRTRKTAPWTPRSRVGLRGHLDRGWQRRRR